MDNKTEVVIQGVWNILFHTLNKKSGNFEQRLSTQPFEGFEPSKG